MELKVGPLGDYSYGEKWEETGRGKISHIFITYDSRCVKSIQFGYVVNGALVLSKRHGASELKCKDDSTRIVRLNHETEFVTGISGKKWIRAPLLPGINYFSPLSPLTFHTNERKHLAFEAELGSLRGKRPLKAEFHSGIHDRRQFGGFFGSFGSFGLSSIGLYIRPILSGVHTIKQENV
ncbi:unnamed protein product [Microthlaspi erraticum]|uniref:Jacalin-type lectin domain-containing protein n=1 Tax=Microthlaspi erraticum TaxID=1685480 RepID=A0A6D2IVM9_9BRAS|nr:unnamed protein product [Microthlaspi erraticum]